MFKTVNDTLAHATGDEVLRDIAVRPRAAVEPGDVVARLGGDEFAVHTGTVDTSAAARTAESASRQ